MTPDERYAALVAADKLKCGECGGTGKLETPGGDWGKTPPGEKLCWQCKGTGKPK
jgi:DnaJ-class molecular chaperone